MGIDNKLAEIEKLTMTRLFLNVFKTCVTVLLAVHLMLEDNSIAVTM